MDDQTQRIDPVTPPDAAPELPEPATAGERAPIESTAAPAEATAAPAAAAAATAPAEVVAASAATAPVAVASGPGRMRWVLGLGVAGVALAAGLAVVLLSSGTSTPEALKYVPNDAAIVAELRMDLPGDQMQALGNLLAHFPGFQDQSTLQAKIDEALSKLVAPIRADLNYATDIKPLLSGPTFLSVRSLETIESQGSPSEAVIVATTTGTVACDTTLKGLTLKHETYKSVDLAVAEGGVMACAVDGRFLLFGNTVGVKLAIDTHANSTGLDKSERYKAARAGLGLDRLATVYLDGAAALAAMPSADPSIPFSDLSRQLPEWMMAGLRAENDALLLDVVTGPLKNPTAIPSMRTYPPVHPLALTALAPSDTLVFLEAQGATVGVHNLLLQLQGDPQMAEALKQLDTVGGIDGLIDWIDDIGVVVVRQGDLPAGAILLVAKDAASATQKVTTIETVLSLGALGGDIQVTSATVEGVKVTTVHIPDISALAGAVPGGAGTLPAIPLDLAIAAKDKVVILGVGEGIVPKLLGVKAGASLADDPAFKRAMGRSLANPQSLWYVAAGTSLDWLESAMAAQGVPALPADVKAYLDPLEGIVFAATGDGTRGNLRFSLTVANP